MATIEDLKREASLPFLVTDHEGFITYTNKHFETVFGWTADEVSGRTLNIVIPSGFQDSHNLGFSRFASTEKSTIVTYLYVLAIGRDPDKQSTTGNLE